MKHRPAMPLTVRTFASWTNKGVLPKDILYQNTFDLAEGVHVKLVGKHEPIVRAGEPKLRQQKVQQSRWRGVDTPKVRYAFFHHPEPGVRHPPERQWRWNVRL